MYQTDHDILQARYELAWENLDGKVGIDYYAARGLVILAMNAINNLTAVDSALYCVFYAMRCEREVMENKDRKLVGYHYRDSLFEAWQYNMGCRHFCGMQEISDPSVRDILRRAVRSRFETRRPLF